MELKELSAKVDLLIESREKRLKLQREVDSLSSLESSLKTELTTELKASGAAAIGGSTHIVSLGEETNKPQAADWTKVWEYITQEQAFDLVQRRLNESAVAGRWEEGIDIPGIMKFPVQKLSINKR